MSRTIFMIHGMWGKGDYWQKYIDFFQARGYSCLNPTLRYHDIDPQDDPDPRLGTTSLLDFAADMEKEIRELDEKPIIVGHSMGGLLAQILASRELANALVLLTPAASSGIFALKVSVMRSFFSMFTRWGFWKKPIRPTFNEAVYSVLHLLSPQEQKEEYGKYVFESGRAASEIGFWLFDSCGAARVDASKIDVPVLVVAGSEDRITPATVVRKVAKKYSNSTYREFPNHAHWVVGEPGWEEIAEFVAHWLEENSS